MMEGWGGSFFGPDGIRMRQTGQRPPAPPQQ